VPYEDARNYNHQARDCARALPGAVWTDQFDNTANTDAHYRTTGPEIWAQTSGTVDAFTAATGTGGTLAGVGRYLKEKSGGKSQVWLADPPGSVLHSYVTSGGTLKERTGSSITEGTVNETSPLFLCLSRVFLARGLCWCAGIGQGRITDNLGTFVDKLDGALQIADEKSIAMVYDVLDTEGLYLGASSALNVVAAYELALLLGPGNVPPFRSQGTVGLHLQGKTITTVLCDGAYRYQSRLFSKKWLQSKGLTDAIPEHLKRYAVLD
jgi:cysteine synthase A